MKRIVMVAVLLVAGLAASAAQAQSRTAYAVTHANLRAGPAIDYPRIGSVPDGARLDIYGCVDDWSWCDVQWRGERGWISAGLIEYDYSGRRVGVSGHGAQIGLPILVFAFDSYWSSHYRNRSWYRDRDRWRDHRPQSRPQQRVTRAGQNSWHASGGNARPVQDTRGQARPGERPQPQSQRQSRQQQQRPQQQQRSNPVQNNRQPPDRRPATGGDRPAQRQGSDSRPAQSGPAGNAPPQKQPARRAESSRPAPQSRDQPPL